MSSKKSSADTSVVDLNAQMEAARLLIAQLRTMETIGDNEHDDQLIADSVEGSTDLFEAIGKVLEAVHWDDGLIAGIKEQEARLKERRARYEARNEKRRWIIENALRLAKKEKFPHPLCTISFRKGRKDSKVEIVDESKLAGEYWKKKDPEINKALISADIKSGKAVDGAKLVDGEDGHSWSWK